MAARTLPSASAPPNRLTALAMPAFALGLSAAGVLLSGGEAQAFISWSPAESDPNPALTYQTTDQVASPGSFDPAWSPWLGDKRMKILSSGSVVGITTPGNDVEWSYKPLQDRPWHMNFDQQGTINIASNLLYRVQIDSSKDGLDICQIYGKCWPNFYQVDFGIQATNPAGPTKSIYLADGDTPGMLLGTLKSGETIALQTGATDLIVSIDWGADQSVGDMYDNYNQAPAPLPILATACVFGSIRKLRFLSSRLKPHTIS